jgi:phosphoglycolate phosphatase-like HAD superfamily hydrolase
MRIALFDIDGTILRSKGAGRRSMERALTRAFGTTGPETYRYDGKTDKQIVRETMTAAGFSDADVDERMDAVIADYVRELHVELDGDAHGTELLPGVAALLDAVERHDDIVLGLLTGNVDAGAARKLRVVGVDHTRFRVSAFGSDHEHRPELPRIARDRASVLLGRPVDGADCVIIGDTPADVACARPIGGRAIAVATGGYDVPTLTACEPEAVFADLSHTDAVIRAILEA